MKKFLQSTFVLFTAFAVFGLTGCPHKPGGGDSPRPGVNAKLIKEIKMQGGGVGDPVFTVDESMVNSVWSEDVIVVFTLTDGIRPKRTKFTVNAGGMELQPELRKQQNAFLIKFKGTEGQSVKFQVSCSHEDAADNRAFTVEFLTASAEAITLKKFELIDEDKKHDMTAGITSGNASWRIYDKKGNKLRFQGEVDAPLTRVLVNGSQDKARIDMSEPKQFAMEYDFPKDVIQPVEVVCSAENRKDLRIKFSFTFTNKPNVYIEVGEEDSNGVFTGVDAISEEAFFSGKKLEFPAYKMNTAAIKISSKVDKITRVTVDGIEVSVTEDPATQITSAQYKLPSFSNIDEENTFVLRIEAETRPEPGETAITREPVEFTFTFVYQKLIENTGFFINDGTAVATEGMREGGGGFYERSGNYRCRRPYVKVKLVFDSDILDIKETDDFDISSRSSKRSIRSSGPGSSLKFTISGKEALVDLHLPDTGEERVELPVKVKADGRSDTIFTFYLRYSASPDKLNVAFAAFWPYPVKTEGPVLDSEGNVQTPLTMVFGQNNAMFWALASNIWNYTSVKINGTECLTDPPPASFPLPIIKSVKNKVEITGHRNVNAEISFADMEQNKAYELDIDLGGTDEIGEALLPAKLFNGKFRMIYK